ncbi:Retrovirus-related Pol polyprotein from transposon TNT 1-94 [Formica fusca]
MKRENERINKLKGEQDWNMWKFQMKILLTSGEAWDVVQGHATKPERPRGENQAEVTEYQKKLKAWVKTDSTAQKLLILNVSEQSMLHLVNCENAKEMWDKLVSVYEGKNATSKYMLQAKWFALTKDPQDDILSHIAKIEDIIHRLKALGEPVTESMIITKILLTLPSSLNHFACA